MKKLLTSKSQVRDTTHTAKQLSLKTVITLSFSTLLMLLVVSEGIRFILMS